MYHLKIMCRPNPSVSMSICHSESETSRFVQFSWNSVLQFCTKRVSSKWVFREKPLNVSCILLKAVNEFLPAPSIFLDGFVWTGTENLHIMPLCKYQINQNRSSGSHTVVQGVNGKIKIFFLNFPSNLNKIRYRKYW